MRSASLILEQCKHHLGDARTVSEARELVAGARRALHHAGAHDALPELDRLCAPRLKQLAVTDAFSTLSEQTLEVVALIGLLKRAARGKRVDAAELDVHFHLAVDSLRWTTDIERLCEASLALFRCFESTVTMRAPLDTIS